MPPGKAATERIELRVTKLERLEWQQAAAREGIPVSEWIRKHLDARTVQRTHCTQAAQYLRDGYVSPSAPNRLWPSDTWQDAIAALERWATP